MKDWELGLTIGGSVFGGVLAVFVVWWVLARWYFPSWRPAPTSMFYWSRMWGGSHSSNMSSSDMGNVEKMSSYSLSFF
jgi:hypothetical protein